MHGAKTVQLLLPPMTSLKPFIRIPSKWIPLTPSPCVCMFASVVPSNQSQFVTSQSDCPCPFAKLRKRKKEEQKKSYDSYRLPTTKERRTTDFFACAFFFFFMTTHFACNGHFAD